MKINSHSLIILLAIISIMSLSGVAYYYFQTNQGMNTTSNQAVKNENIQSDVLQPGGVESLGGMIADLSGMTHQETGEAYFNKGNSLHRLGKYQEAIDAFNKSIELNPKNAVAYYNKGSTLAYLGKNQEAIDAYDEAIELDPKNADVYNNKGGSLNDLGKYQEALDTIDIGLKNVPNDPDLLEIRKKIVSFLK